LLPQVTTGVFLGHESLTVWNGQKIAGDAQRRTRSGLLNSRLGATPALSLDRHQWQEGMCNVGGQNGDQWQPFDPDLHFSRRRESCGKRYSQASYNRKR